MVTADGNGSLFYEGFGDLDESTMTASDAATALPMLLRSKQIYPAGILGEVEIGMMGVRSTGPSQLDVTLRTYTADGSRTFQVSDPTDPVSVEQGNTVANRFEIEVAGTGDAEFNVMEVEVDSAAGVVER